MPPETFRRFAPIDSRGWGEWSFQRRDIGESSLQLGGEEGVVPQGGGDHTGQGGTS